MARLPLPRFQTLQNGRRKKNRIGTRYSTGSESTSLQCHQSKHAHVRRQWYCTRLRSRSPICSRHGMSLERRHQRGLPEDYPSDAFVPQEVPEAKTTSGKCTRSARTIRRCCGHGTASSPKVYSSIETRSEWYQVGVIVLQHHADGQGTLRRLWPGRSKRGLIPSRRSTLGVKREICGRGQGPRAEVARSWSCHMAEGGFPKAWQAYLQDGTTS
jgi:hypothetical protein